MESIRHILARLLPHAGHRSVVLLGEGADHIAHVVDGELIVRQSRFPIPTVVQRRPAGKPLS